MALAVVWMSPSATVCRCTSLPTASACRKTYGANTGYLIDRAFRAQQDNTAFQLRQEEYPVFMGSRDMPLDFNLYESREASVAGSNAATIRLAGLR